MKLVAIALALFAALSTQAQYLAVLTHGAANTEEFKAGCPTNWPASIKDIGSSTNLPAELSATNGWVVMKAADLEATKESLSALKEVFNKKWLEINGPGRTWSALEFNKRIRQFAPDALDTIDDLIAAPDTPSPLRKQLRQLNRMLLAAQDINSKDEATVNGFQAAVLLGLLTQKQSDDILTGP